MREYIWLAKKLIKKVKLHKREIRIIYRLYDNYIIKNILIGILLIETSYRKSFVRLIENTAVIFNCILNILLNVKVKNYTIGKMQIGISSILNYYGYKEYDEHSRYLDKITFDKFFCIMKGMFINNNIQIAYKKIKLIYNKLIKENCDINSVIGHIGEWYNGKETYGFLLQELVKNIKVMQLD